MGWSKASDIDAAIRKLKAMGVRNPSNARIAHVAGTAPSTVGKHLQTIDPEYARRADVRRGRTTIRAKIKYVPNPAQIEAGKRAIVRDTLGAFPGFHAPKRGRVVRLETSRDVTRRMRKEARDGTGWRWLSRAGSAWHDGEVA